jgi:hypothetical protein
MLGLYPDTHEKKIENKKPPEFRRLDYCSENPEDLRENEIVFLNS